MSDEMPVLIVDGNAYMSAMLQRFLERHNIPVQVARSVPEARDILDHGLFHLVLADLFLPHREGLALLRHIRQTAPHTLVVLMVAFGSPEMCQHVLAEGAYACLKKPFSLQCLWGVLQQAMQNSNPV
jgi:two-component system response regulator PilR (NtrC family)